MDQGDIKIAEALLTRAAKFAAAFDFIDALLDVSAAYRLFAYNHDARAEEAHQKWTDIYHRYQASKTAPPPSPLPQTQEPIFQTSAPLHPTEALNTLLSQIKQRRR